MKYLYTQDKYAKKLPDGKHIGRGHGSDHFLGRQGDKGPGEERTLHCVLVYCLAFY